MEMADSVSLRFRGVGTLMVSAEIAIYQWVVINEAKKRRSELQKQQAWQNQIATLQKLESAQDWE